MLAVTGKTRETLKPARGVCMCCLVERSAIFMKMKISARGNCVLRHKPPMVGASLPNQGGFDKLDESGVLKVKQQCEWQVGLLCDLPAHEILLGVPIFFKLN